MAGSGSARRGQPLIALATILAIWTAVRMAVWTPLFEPMSEAPADTIQADRPTAQVGGLASGPTSSGEQGEIVHEARSLIHVSGAGRAMPRGKQASMFDLANYTTSYSMPEGRSRRAIRPARGGSLRPWSGTADATDGQRWSGDAWLLVRDGGGNPAQAPGAASYGASQAGAVVRYRFGDRRAQDVYGYIRASLAIDAPGKDKEAALGLGIRPVKNLPLRALAEVRLQDSSQGPPRIRPVATVVTELPWQDLPLGLRGEAYAQAGYAGGRDRTAFFDAQVLADRPVNGLLPAGAELRVGAGVWAGGQKDAVRFDIGPRVSVGLDLGPGTPVRVAIDWRIRVGGNARPGSGPALTVASSF